MDTLDGKTESIFCNKGLQVGLRNDGAILREMSVGAQCTGLANLPMPIVSAAGQTSVEMYEQGGHV